MPVARVLALGLLLSLGACSSVGSYLGDRGLDLIDIADLKYGLGIGGVVKVEATDYLSSGLGMGGSGYQEWYGRRMEEDGLLNAQAVLAGTEHFDGPRGSKNVMLLTQYSSERYRPPPPQRWRIGVEAIAVFPHLGIYINCFEIVDFFGGIVGLDPAEDDEVSYGESFRDYRSEYYKRRWSPEPE